MCLCSKRMKINQLLNVLKFFMTTSYFNMNAEVWPMFVFTKWHSGVCGEPGHRVGDSGFWHVPRLSRVRKRRNVQTWQPSNPTDGCSHTFQMFPDKEQRAEKHSHIFCRLCLELRMPSCWHQRHAAMGRFHFLPSVPATLQPDAGKSASGFLLRSHGPVTFASPLLPSRRQRSAPESG